MYAKSYKEKTMPEMQQDLRAKPLLTSTSCVPTTPPYPSHPTATDPPPPPLHHRYKADYDGRQGAPCVLLP